MVAKLGGGGGGGRVAVSLGEPMLECNIGRTRRGMPV